MSIEAGSAAAGAAQRIRRGASASPGSDADATQQQLAWQREMERAQLSTWFKPTPAGLPKAPATTSRPSGDASGDGDFVKSGAASSALRGAEAEATGGAVVVTPPQGSMESPCAPVENAAVPAPALSSSNLMATKPAYGDGCLTAATAAVDRAGSFEDRQPLQLTGVRTRDLPPPSSELPSVETEVAPAAPLEPTPTLVADLEPIRLHVETRPEGQAVWIAVRADDDALLAMLPRIVADLERELRHRGQQLHQVVCNGRLVWSGGTAISLEKEAGVFGDRPESAIDQLQTKEA